MSAAEELSPAAPALDLAARGFRIFPLRPNAKAPFKGTGGALDATDDAEQIRRWWQAQPHANIGIGAAASGLLILDVDIKNGVDGAATLADLQARFGALPRTLSARTPTGNGSHLYFRAPVGVDLGPSAGKIGPGLDVRAGNSYVVAPPSTFGGRPYTWTDEAPIAELPVAWVDLLAPKPVAERPAPLPRENVGDVERRALAYLDKMDPAISGSGGHQATWAAALVLARGFDLSESDTLRILRQHYNPRCEPPWSDKELEHKAKEARAKAQLPAGYLLNDDRGWDRRIALPPEPRAELESTAGVPQLKGEAAPKASWLDAWPTIGERGGWFSEPPPRREWLLQRTDAETGELVGVLGRGIVGLLLAPGGRGKTWALVQLAISVATGRRWLDTFDVEQGNVLLALAEEDVDEVRRRLYWAARALELTAEELRAAEERIVPLGLAGELVGLVDVDRAGKVSPSEVHAAMTAKLAEREWALVILDPLSRWAPGVESTNEGATVAVSLLEALAKAPGRPTVLAAHHTAKWDRREGNKADSGAGARGVTGLTDGVRWAAKLTGSTEKDLAFQVVKVNGAPMAEPLSLMRDPESGVLRPLSLTEGDERTARVKAKQDAVLAAVLAAVTETPGLGTKGVRDAVKAAGQRVRAGAVDTAILDALDLELIVDEGSQKRHAYHLGPRAVEYGVTSLSACPGLSEGVRDNPPDTLSACPVPIGTSRTGQRWGKRRPVRQPDKVAPPAPDEVADDFSDPLPEWAEDPPMRTAPVPRPVPVERTPEELAHLEALGFGRGAS